MRRDHLSPRSPANEMMASERATSLFPGNNTTRFFNKIKNQLEEPHIQIVDQSNLVQRASSHTGIPRRDKMTEAIRGSTHLLMEEETPVTYRTVSGFTP